MKRTANCKKCGCVEFRLLPKIGTVEYICVDCGALVQTVDYGCYTTTKDTCSNCNGDKFKVTISKEEGNEYWDTACANCGSDIIKYYVDKNGETINTNKRELLLVEDYMQEIKAAINELKVKMTVLKDLSNTDNSASKISSYLDDCRSDIYKLDKKVKDCEDELWNMERNTD